MPSRSLDNRIGQHGLALAVAAVAAATMGRAAITQFSSDSRTTTFTPFYAAIVFASMYGGWSGGLCALVLSTIVSMLLWPSPETLFGPASLTSLGLFVAVGCLIVWLTHLTRLARLRAEHAEHKVQTVLASITDGFVAVDFSWRYTYVNEAAEAYFGVAEADLIGRNCWEAFPQTVGTPLEHYCRRSMERRELVTTELQSPLDKESWLHLRGYPTAEGISIWFRDITLEKKLSAAHLQQQGRFHLALTAARMTAWELSLQDNRVTMSASAPEVLGVPPASLPGDLDGAKGFIHPDDYQRHSEIVQAAARTAVGEYQSRFRLAPTYLFGRPGPIWLEDRGRLIHDAHGQLTTVQGVLQDITERHNTEERINRLNSDLRDRIEELQAVLDVAPVGIAIATDPTCETLIVSPQFASLAGLPDASRESLTRVRRETLPMRVVCDGQDVHPANLPMRRAAATLQPVWNDECDFVRPDGTVRHVLINAAPLFDHAGQVRGAVGVHVDISARVAADQERQQLLDVTEASREAAERSSHAKDEFLAVLSHELRSPMQSVLGWVQVLRNSSLDPAASDRALDTIERNLRQQSQLINDMLDVSRIVTGKLVFHLTTLPLSRVVREIVDELRPLADDKAVGIAVDISGDPFMIGDRERVRQVVSNLFTNAIKFTPAGGSVVVRCHQLDGQARLEVSDTGDGIPDYLVGSIFERFRQADTSSTREHEGLGLGLSITRHIVEHLGGRIEASSKGVNRGATFTVVFPLAPTAQATARPGPAAPAAQDERALAGLDVLVVDDHRDTVDLLAFVLGRAGAVVRKAASAEEAYAAYMERPADVLLTDLSMPGQDGYALLARVRASRSGARTQALALSGLARPDDRRRALQAGFAAHLAKPVEPEALIEAVEQAQRRLRTSGVSVTHEHDTPLVP